MRRNCEAYPFLRLENSAIVYVVDQVQAMEARAVAIGKPDYFNYIFPRSAIFISSSPHPRLTLTYSSPNLVTATSASTRQTSPARKPRDWMRPGCWQIYTSDTVVRWSRQRRSLRAILTLLRER